MSLAGNILIGTLIAVACIWAFRSNNLKKEVKSWGIALIIAGLVYMGFSFMKYPSEWILIEFLATLFCVLIYILGVKYSSYIIAVGWLVHIFWDYYIHMQINPGYSPEWYPHFCIGFDLLVGIYLAFQLIKKSNFKTTIAADE